MPDERKPYTKHGASELTRYQRLLLVEAGLGFAGGIATGLILGAWIW